jgi:glycosyltransferase involved in cell wall biosynthesis
MFMDKSIRRKILVVTDAWKPQVNGVVRTYEYLAIELEALGHEVKIIGPADFPLRLPTPGYREIETVLFPGRRLARLIDAYQPTSLHVATEGTLGWAARRYAIKHGIRYTSAYHTQFPDYLAQRVGWRLPFLENWVRARTDAVLRRFHKPAAGIITTTASIDAELRQRGYDSPLYRLTRGVPAAQFGPGEATLFQGLKRPVALYVGRVAIEKNIGEFLSMPWEGSKVVVGDGPSLNELKAKYKDVIFTGRKTGTDLAAHYRAADIFVFPSRTDTFGIVLLEALASGLPVAAHDVPGPRDIITAPYLGVLHDNLGSAAERALEIKDEAQKRRDHVRENYAWPAVARQFLAILDETGT